MNFGIEIECILRKNIDHCYSGTVHSYHGAHTNDLYQHWHTERDSSIHNVDDEGLYDDNGWCDSVTPCEFITNKLRGMKAVERALEELEAAVPFEDIVINKSMGCHIHFSHTASQREIYNIPLSYMEKIAERYLAWITAWDPAQAKAYTKQYNRAYAKKVTVESYENSRSDRQTEFCQTANKGMEWRAFNLLGVSSWRDIKKRIQKACSIISEVYKTMRNEEMFLVGKVMRDSAHKKGQSLRETEPEKNIIDQYVSGYKEEGGVYVKTLSIGSNILFNPIGEAEKYVYEYLKVKFPDTMQQWMINDMVIRAHALKEALMTGTINKYNNELIIY